MKKTKRPAKIKLEDLAALAKLSQTDEWKILRRLRQATIYNLIQKEFKFPPNDPHAAAVNKAWTQGAVYSLKRETTEIDSAIEELDKRRQQ